MEEFEIPDPLFREAIAAMDKGDIDSLKLIVNKHPELVNTRLSSPTEGYFQYPYLLWFVADNPIRVGKLSPNIVEMADVIIKKMQENKSDDYTHQIGYAAGLVVTGRIPRECGVQIRLIDLLIDAGAGIGGSIGALANGNFEVAEHLINRGEKLTLTAAVGLGRTDDIPGLTMQASKADLQEALVTAAFFGKATIIKFLLDKGADPNTYLEKNSGFHRHATALHQAVWSGSLEAVKVLVESGANLNLTDRVYDGTPLGWAKYAQTEEMSEEMKKKYKKIEEYLEERI